MVGDTVDSATADLLTLIDSLTPTADDAGTIRQLIKSGANVHYRSESGASLLHLLASRGNLSGAIAVLRCGAQWNAVDNAVPPRSAGEYALAAGHDDVYQFLVNEGARTELLLMALGASGTEAFDVNDSQEDAEASDVTNVPVDTKVVDGADEASLHPSNAGYLSQKLTFSDGRLLDAEQNGVMMGWEDPLMVLHADVIAPTPGLSVLNVGFGLGLIDTHLQARQPRQHTIIEAHPDVYAQMIRDGWDKKPGVKILFGRWQDVLGELEAYDGIFFDTFGEYYDDLKEFHEHLPNILNQDGVYSFFNGLAGTNPFFHDVACAVAQADLQDMGIATTFKEVAVDDLGDETWKDIKRAYWTLPIYRLPICRFE